MSPELKTALNSYEHWLIASTKIDSETLRYDTRVMLEKRRVLIAAIERLEELMTDPTPTTDATTGTVPTPEMIEAAAAAWRSTDSSVNDRIVAALTAALVVQPRPIVSEAMVEAGAAAWWEDYFKSNVPWSDPGILGRDRWRHVARTILTAALAAAPPPSVADGLDAVLARIEAMGYDQVIHMRRLDSIGWHFGTFPDRWDSPHYLQGRGATRLEAALALEAAIADGRGE